MHFRAPGSAAAATAGLLAGGITRLSTSRLSTARPWALHVNATSCGGVLAPRRQAARPLQPRRQGPPLAALGQEELSESAAGHLKASAATGKEEVADTSGRWPLFGVALVVYTLTGFLQERVSRAPDFNGPLLVMCETGAYVVGGLLWACLERGREGLRNCVRPARYLAFLPASLAFFAMNFLQYPSLRVFGVVNHALLCQLNLAVMAVILFLWKNQRFLPVQWASLAHLSLGLLFLVLSAPSAVALGPEQLSFGLLAVAACIGASAFASLYLEATLKASAADAIFVQLHQMNLVQAVSALALFLQGLAAHPATAVALSPQTAGFLALAVTRGALMSLMLKKAGSLANGLVGLGSIICIAALQLFVDGREPVGMGLQATIIMSVVNYLYADQQGQATTAAAASKVRPRALGPMAVQAALLLSLLAFLPEGARNAAAGWFASAQT